MAAEKKYFPIKTATACQSKWNWSSLWLTQGDTASCHRVNHLPVPLEDFDNFHNLPKKVQDRELMLDGKWPAGGCEYCQKIEEAGGMSDRIMHADIPALLPPELETNPVATHISPTIVEVFINNTCNLSCTYCRAGNSSKIQHENKKFGDFKVGGVNIVSDVEYNNQQQQYFEKFCSWLERNSSTLNRLHLLGGEPFFQQETDVILDILDKQSNPHLELQIVSNLMVKHERFRGYIERIKQMCARQKIKRLDLTASIDCWGAEAEYARTGLDLTQWQENFEYLVSQKWIKLNINQTITVLSIRTMPELIRRLNQYRQTRPIGHHFSLVTGNDRNQYMHPEIFGGEFWRQDLENILAEMIQDNSDNIRAYTYMQGIVGLILASTPNSEIITQLHIYLDELDRRRGTNWRSIFPYLDR